MSPFRARRHREIHAHRAGLPGVSVGGGQAPASGTATTPPRNRIQALTQWLGSHPPLSWLRQSLSVRITVIMAVVAALMMALLSIFVTSNIRDGMFAERLDTIIQDAAVRANYVQSAFEQVNVTTTDQVQDVAYQTMNVQQQSVQGAGGVGAMLLRTPESTSVINEIVQRQLQAVVSPELREAVATEGGQHWQSVALPAGDDTTAPGVVVGTPVNLPLVGTHEFILVYTLAPEQNTIDMIVQVLTVGTLALLLVLMVVIWGVSYQTLLPITRAADTAKMIAAGDLDARVRVDGCDELASLAQSFNGMADTLQDRLSEYAKLATLQQRFVSDVSHELRTPMTTIHVAAEHIAAEIEDIPPHLRRSVQLLHNEAERFASMLADLLEISRFDANSATPEFGEEDLSEIIRQVIAAAMPIADDHGVVIETTLPGPVIAEVDRVRIARIVRNLVLNAIEHAEGKPVRIKLLPGHTSAAIQVRDWGVGMTDQVAAHVFDRFYRADSSRARKVGGTGLGLAISAEDAAIHSGVLTVLGCPGQGTSFLLVLPLRQDEEITDLPSGIVDNQLMAARAQWAMTHPEDITEASALNPDTPGAQTGLAGTGAELTADGPGLEPGAGLAPTGVEDPQWADETDPDPAGGKQPRPAGGHSDAF